MRKNVWQLTITNPILVSSWRIRYARRWRGQERLNLANRFSTQIELHSKNSLRGLALLRSRPQEKEDVAEWIAQQKAMFKTNKLANANFTLTLSDFPKSEAGRLHLTTAKNVFYLMDSNRDVEAAIRKAFPRLENAAIEGDGLAFLYISNSLKPGRIFGDPFTGQLSAFANIFTKDVLGQKTRTAIAYYPHQVHTQLVADDGVFKKNKGITIMRDLLDYAIFQGGVLVNLKTGKIL